LFPWKEGYHHHHHRDLFWDLLAGAEAEAAEPESFSPSVLLEAAEEGVAAFQPADLPGNFRTEIRSVR
jgi:hypothetical protein